MHETRLVPQMMMSPGCWRQAFRCTRRLLTARVTVISGTSSRCRLKMIKSLLLLLYCSSETTHTQNLQYSDLSALTSTNRSICLLLAEGVCFVRRLHPNDENYSNFISVHDNHTQSVSCENPVFFNIEISTYIKKRCHIVSFFFFFPVEKQNPDSGTGLKNLMHHFGKW